MFDGRIILYFAKVVKCFTHIFTSFGWIHQELTENGCLLVRCDEKPGGATPPGYPLWLLGGHLLKAFFQIDFVRHGNDGAAQHELFVRGILAHGSGALLQPEYKGKHILQLAAKVIISPLGGIGLLLKPDKRIQIVQTEYILTDGNKEQIGNLIPAVLFSDRILNQAPLHIIGNHGVRNAVLLNGRQIFRNIFGCLLQIKPYRGNFAVAWETEVPNRGHNPLLTFVCHFDHRRYYTANSETCQSGL